MTGGLGADVFVMTGDSFTGADLITDFDAAIDVIHLSDDHRNSVTLSDTASGVLVTWDNGSVLLEGETTAALSDDMFVYI